MNFYKDGKTIPKAGDKVVFIDPLGDMNSSLVKEAINKKGTVIKVQGEYIITDIDGLSWYTERFKKVDGCLKDLIE